MAVKAVELRKIIANNKVTVDQVRNNLSVLHNAARELGLTGVAERINSQLDNLYDVSMQLGNSIRE